VGDLVPSAELDTSLVKSRKELEWDIRINVAVLELLPNVVPELRDVVRDNFVKSIDGEIRA
jgi:hypothetical protein